MKQKFEAERADTLIGYLSFKLAGVPRERIKIQLKRGEVRLNGSKVYNNVNIEKGDILEIFLPEKFAAPNIDVVYNDDFIIVADKPPFVESEYALPELIEKSTGIKTAAAHRLDTNTTGLVILCKTEQALSAMVNAFANGQVVKTYYAKVFGCPKDNKGTLTAYLKKNSSESFCKIYSKPVPGAKEIITEYEVVLRGEVSVLKLHPVTGRTHQLRAHMAFIGCPIVGDDKYGDADKNKSAGAKYQKLRAAEIKFLKIEKPLGHLSGKVISVSADEFTGIAEK